MSGQNSHEAKAARREERLSRKLTSQTQHSQTLAHGICRECNRRTHVWLPLRWCSRCLDKSE